MIKMIRILFPKSIVKIVSFKPCNKELRSARSEYLYVQQINLRRVRFSGKKQKHQSCEISQELNETNMKLRNDIKSNYLRKTIHFHIFQILDVKRFITLKMFAFWNKHMIMRMCTYSQNKMNRHCCSEIKCMYYGTNPDVNLIDPEVIAGPLTDPIMCHCMCVTKHSLSSFVAYLFGIVPPLSISVFQ